MARGAASVRNGRWRLATSWLLLAFFTLRALIPAGYMPDLAHLGDGGFKVVLCTADGLRTVILDGEGRPVEPEKRKSGAGDECPFGATASKAFLAAEPTRPIAIPPHGGSAIFTRYDLALLPPAQGPPLGSRAPPAILG